jgi:hypothetical protein
MPRWLVLRRSVAERKKGPVSEAFSSGRTWDRTRDLPRVKQSPPFLQTHPGVRRRIPPRVSAGRVLLPRTVVRWATHQKLTTPISATRRSIRPSR